MVYCILGHGAVFAEPISGDPDAWVIGELEKYGSDLTKEHVIEFVVYFSSLEKAESASQELKKSGFDINLEKNESLGEWDMLAKKKMLPSLIELKKIRKKLNALGNYDGWSSFIVEKETPNKFKNENASKAGPDAA